MEKIQQGMHKESKRIIQVVEKAANLPYYTSQVSVGTIDNFELVTRQVGESKIAEKTYIILGSIQNDERVLHLSVSSPVSSETLLLSAHDAVVRAIEEIIRDKQIQVNIGQLSESDSLVAICTIQFPEKCEASAFKVIDQVFLHICGQLRKLGLNADSEGEDYEYGFDDI